jgi:hypothetical protein
MRIPSRRTFWFSAALLLAIVVGVWLLLPRSRITQANFDQIREGASEAEVSTILGPEDETSHWRYSIFDYTTRYWHSGPNSMNVVFYKGRVTSKDIYLANTGETLQWCAEKIGIKPRILE